MKTKDLLNEWKNFLNKEMINEVSLKIFQQQHPEFDTSSFEPDLRGNTDYLDIISNSINAGQNHGPEEFVQQFEYYKSSIMPNRNNQTFLTVEIPGDETVSLEGKLNPGSCTATYDDIQEFQNARMFALGKGSRDKLTAAYTKILEEANDLDFELVAENSDWIIYYPKTVKGSISLARSYWDGSKIAYDTTFNPSKGFGKNTGVIGWCTSVSGAGNMFLNYHRKLNLHMYYCIKKSISSISDPDRKLCISFSKHTKQDPPIQFNKGHSSVNGDNISLSEEYSKNKLGSLFDNLLKDVAESKRLEIDSESYYKSISIDQYIIMRNANEENVADFQSEVSQILQYSKDSNKIAYHAAKDSNNEIRNAAANSPNTPPEVLSDLSKDEDARIRNAVARNTNTPPEVLSDLSYDYDDVRRGVAINTNTPPEVLTIFAQDKDLRIKIYIARRKDLLEIDPSGEIVRILSRDHPRVRAELARNLLELDDSNTFINQFVKDKNYNVRAAIADRADLLEIDPSGEIIRKLTNDKDFRVRLSLASNENSPEKALQILAKDEHSHVRQYVAGNRNSPDNILLSLVSDEAAPVRYAVAMNPNAQLTTLQKLSNDEAPHIRSYVSERLKNIKNESILRAYVKLIMS